MLVHAQLLLQRKHHLLVLLHGFGKFVLLDEVDALANYLVDAVVVVGAVVGTFNFLHDLWRSCVVALDEPQTFLRFCHVVVPEGTQSLQFHAVVRLAKVFYASGSEEATVATGR